MKGDRKSTEPLWNFSSVASRGRIEDAELLPGFGHAGWDDIAVHAVFVAAESRASQAGTAFIGPFRLDVPVCISYSRLLCDAGLYG